VTVVVVTEDEDDAAAMTQSTSAMLNNTVVSTRYTIVVRAITRHVCFLHCFLNHYSVILTLLHFAS